MTDTLGTTVQKCFTRALLTNYWYLQSTGHSHYCYSVSRYELAQSTIQSCRVPVWCCNNVSMQDSKPSPFAGVRFTNKNAVNVETPVYEVMTSCKKRGKWNHRQMKHATILFGRYKVLSWNKLHFSCQNSHKNNISFCHIYSSCVEGCPALGFHCFHIFKQKFPFNTLKRLYNHYTFLDGQTLPQLIITHGVF